jgi:hypothetical protein
MVGDIERNQLRYDDLPRDPVEAFIYLEELFRNLF